MKNAQSLEQKPLKIAVIGSGISGMAAAWLLAKTHFVTVYEKENKTGGHSNTVKVLKDDLTQPVDTGFIVYNKENYPNLVELFKYLKVDTQPTKMSFSVSLDKGEFELGSNNLDSFFGQRSNIFKYDFWYMLSDIKKFFHRARAFQSSANQDTELTLGDFLKQGKYREPFIIKFILPMGAAIWSAKPGQINQQPAITFINFFFSHGLLQFQNPIRWRTVTGGSKNYVEKLTAGYLDKIKLSQGVTSIVRKDNRIDVTDIKDQKQSFDHVVIATHADQALKMLSDPDTMEKDLLGSFEYTNNEVILHSDPLLMPKRKNVWSSWNFLGDTEKGVSVTYWMNLLQSIDNKTSYFVTVNPKFAPDKKLLHKTFQYGHPCFTSKAWSAQQKLWNLQGRRNTWFCGSYFGYGFHEDGLQAGLAVAEELGNVERPWNLEKKSTRITQIRKSDRVSE
jgi:predicted NAD/FAD-binding protein